MSIYVLKKSSEIDFSEKSLQFTDMAVKLLLEVGNFPPCKRQHLDLNEPQAEPVTLSKWTSERYSLKIKQWVKINC